MNYKKENLRNYLDHNGNIRRIKNNWVKCTINVDNLLLIEASEILQFHKIEFTYPELMTALVGTKRHLDILFISLSKKVMTADQVKCNYAIRMFDTTEKRKHDVSCNPISSALRANTILRAIPRFSKEEIEIIIQEILKIQQNEVN